MNPWRPEVEQGAQEESFFVLFNISVIHVMPHKCEDRLHKKVELIESMY